MEIAGYTYTWGPIIHSQEVNYPELFQWYRERGISSIELFDPWIEDKGDAHVEHVANALREYQMSPCVCDVNCHVVSRDPSERKRGAERFQDRLSVVNRLGIPNVLVIPSLPPYESDYQPKECQDYLNEALSESLPCATELNITLMIANLGFRGDIYGKADWVVETCRALPALRTVYDVGNFVMAGEDPVEAIDKVFPYLIHVHLKDWIIFSEEQKGVSWIGHGGKWYQACKFGEGVVPLHDAVRRLKELGYDGLVSPEYEGPGDPYEVMGQAIEYTKNLLK